MLSQDVNRLIREATGIERDDFDSDLNAMHEAEKVMTDKDAYGIKLRSVVQQQAQESFFKTFCATASQRAEAFLRTMGRWVE